MARVLLINSNSHLSPYPVFPLGLAYLASSLLAQGHEVTIADPQDSLVALSTVKPQFIGVSIRNIDDVDGQSRKLLADESINLVKHLRERTSVPITLGGSGFSLFPERLLALSGVEYGIRGEGEWAFPALIQALERGQDPRGIPGLVIRSAFGSMSQPCSSTMPALPKRPASLAKRYIDNSSMLNVQTQRGCPFACCYCSYPVIEGCQSRLFSPEDVAEDFFRASRLGARYLYVVDSVFNTSPDHVFSVCEEIIRREIQISWGCFLRPSGVTGAMATLMARAGAKHVEFGSDSLCDSVLFSYGKGLGVENIVHSHNAVISAGIHAAHFLITGGPGETEQTIRESFDNSRHLRKTAIFPFPGMRIYPHTPLQRIATNEGIISEETDLFSPTYYHAPALTYERMADLLKQFRSRTPRWIVGQPIEEMVTMLGRLRARGVIGPMWEFLVS